MNKRKVILVTDGDKLACKAVEKATQNIGARCISASAGNPTPLTGDCIVELIKKAHHDPVVVMFDDKGSREKGQGETALEYVVRHPDIEVLGALAVASHTDGIEGAQVDIAVNGCKQVVEGQVNKEGNMVSSAKVVQGDTVDVLNEVRDKIPLIVGIGDIGKMGGRDNPDKGAQVTTKALKTIMEQGQNH